MEVERGDLSMAYSALYSEEGFIQPDDGATFGEDMG